MFGPHLHALWGYSPYGVGAVEILELIPFREARLLGTDHCDNRPAEREMTHALGTIRVQFHEEGRQIFGRDLGVMLDWPRLR